MPRARRTLNCLVGPSFLQSTCGGALCASLGILCTAWPSRISDASIPRNIASVPPRSRCPSCRSLRKCTAGQHKMPVANRSCSPDAVIYQQEPIEMGGSCGKLRAVVASLPSSSSGPTQGAAFRRPLRVADKLPPMVGTLNVQTYKDWKYGKAS